MASIRYPFTMYDHDRHGKKRWYVRLVVNGKNKKRRIRANEGSEAWVAEYHAILEDMRESERPKSKNPYVTVYSLAWMINQYITSPQFKEARPATQIQRWSTIAHFKKRAVIEIVERLAVKLCKQVVTKEPVRRAQQTIC